MNKPEWLKPGVEVIVNCDVYSSQKGKSVRGVRCLVPMDTGSFVYLNPTGGEDYDVKVVNEELAIDEWVGWNFIELATPLKPKKVPNKTERKKVAQQVKVAFDKLVAEIDAAEELGLEVDLYLCQDDWNEKMISVSYQPPRPPLEEYV